MQVETAQAGETIVEAVEKKSCGLERAFAGGVFTIPGYDKNGNV